MRALLGSVRRRWRFFSIAVAMAAGAAVAAVPAGSADAATGCNLGPGGVVKHVIIIQFDNVHLERDNSNVPSDIEQIPALYDFMTQNGTLLANDHTVLISHTADGIISTETGMYPDQNGTGVANDFPYLDPFQTKTRGTSVPGTSECSAFTYWTDLTNSSADPLYTLIHGPASSTDPNGVNTPAPWAAFTRAGCDFAGIGSADMEFENDTTDISNVYGSSSSQYALGNWSYNTAYDQYFNAGSNLGETDFEGLAIHCSVLDSGPGGLCSTANGGKADVLPDEQGGYSGYNALFGALNVDPALTGKTDQALPANYTPAGDTPPPAGEWQAPPVYDVFAPNANNTGSHAAPDPGNVPAETVPAPSSYTPGVTPTTEILDSTNNPGFPGFDGMEANNALGYTAAAQEAGVPVTYTYVSDVHDDQYEQNDGDAFGPGEAGYEAQLHEYNAAFTAFFARLARDGITKKNTLFLFTVDEGDHYDGGPPLNPGCNGYQVPCQYGTPGTTARDEGEIDTNLPALIKSEGDSTTFGFDADDAPAMIVPNQTSPSGTRPGPDDPAVRRLERTISGTREYSEIDDKYHSITVNMADETEEEILHMVNSDPNRTPTFTLFGDPSFYFQASCDGGPGQGPGAGCPTQDGDFAWNHGDIQPEIANTWDGWVGPGVKSMGENTGIWVDHTDIRPTLMTILGLTDDYAWDGRAIAQILSAQSGAMPATIKDDLVDYERLSGVYKQLDAPFGKFGLQSLGADTHALATDSSGDSTYVSMDQQLQACESARSALLPAIQDAIYKAETGQQEVGHAQAVQLIGEATALIHDTAVLESSTTPPAQLLCR